MCVAGLSGLGCGDMRTKKRSQGTYSHRIQSRGHEGSMDIRTRGNTRRAVGGRTAGSSVEGLANGIENCSIDLGVGGECNE